MNILELKKTAMATHMLSHKLKHLHTHINKPMAAFVSQSRISSNNRATADEQPAV